MTLTDIRSMLERLWFPEAECVFCHCSIQGLGLSLREGRGLIEMLVGLMRPNQTLAVPSFPYATATEYREYVSAPIRYDVELTAARVNLVGEMFRRMKDARRSSDPIYPIAVIGPLAEELTEGNHLDSRPFGPRTGLGRIAARPACVLGLGVTVNTNSFAHLLDEPFLARLPVRIYPEQPRPATILRGGAVVGSGEYYYVTPGARVAIRPGRIHEHILGRPFYRCVEGGPPCYAFDLRAFVDFGVAFAGKALDAGELPVWHRPA